MNARTAAGATARGARADEWQACRDLCERAGQNPSLYDTLTRTDPEHVPDYVRVVDAGGRPVSLALTIPRRVIVAGIPVEGAVIALVGTDPAHCGRGYAHLLLEDTAAFLRARGFRIVLARGPDGLLGRFGFVPCLDDYRLEFRRPPPGADRPPGGSRWRPLEPGDVPSVARLFASASARTPCTVVRPAQPWVWWSGKAGSGIEVLEAGDAILAYVRYGDESERGAAFGVAEVGATATGLLPAVLARVAEKAAEAGRELIRFSGPPDHPFARLVELRLSATVGVRPGVAGQVLLANRGLLMADLVPVFSAAAARRGLPGGTRLVLDIGPKRIELAYSAGVVRLLGGRAGADPTGVTRLSAEAFTRLAVGSVAGGEVDLLPGTTVDPDHREVLEVFFPRAFPHWSPAPYWSA